MAQIALISGVGCNLCVTLIICATIALAWLVSSTYIQLAVVIWREHDVIIGQSNQLN
jgi:hypothetical protein